LEHIIINTLFILFYIWSIYYLGFRFMMLGVCYGDVHSAIIARHKFVFSYIQFMVSSILMAVHLSLWFIVPFALTFVVVVIVLYECYKDKIPLWNKD
jgi:hypothetical protein